MGSCELQVGTTVELPEVRVQKKIKSMQVGVGGVDTCNLAKCSLEKGKQAVLRVPLTAYSCFCHVQVFKRPVQSCKQGDRAGICVTQLDPKLIERGIVCMPGSVPTFSAAIAAVERVRFFSGKLPSSGKV